MAHRNEHIARALDALQAIKAAVVALHGPDDIANHPEHAQRDVDRVVQLYCAENTADALSYLQRE